MIFNTKPVPKPRMTQRDKWAKRDCVVNYYAYKDDLILQAQTADGGPFELPNEFRVVFGVPFPRSYSKKKREKLLGQAHQVKPDVDNYLKGLMDAFKASDSDVWHVDVKKIWTEGRGCICVESLDERD